MDGLWTTAALLIVVAVVAVRNVAVAISREEKMLLKEEAKEMFYHAYRSYMVNAYPADELMPLSCKGRYRDAEPTRGDIDDALGNFSLTLVDALDTLVILGDVDEFERAVRIVIRDVSFDNDVVVSVFETNIRMLGGLISSHVLVLYIQEKQNRMLWYKGELLAMAKDLGYRLLPAFNTSTGVPHPRINLRYGLKSAKLGNVRETCTACAGTMILELAALSRLTGESVFEEKAHQAMDFLWQQRHRASDLMGTVINIHSGDWIRRDSGVGAGIDSYYEYCLKAYILLGYESYLERFNKHYSAIMKYVSQGPLLLDVHMHRPHTNSRNFMDSLLAFWPGLQVLKGDIKPAIETHEMLYQVMQRHNLLPEAFTIDFQVHWGQHPLRPEFLESTYFLYKATGDSYYLEVGKNVLQSLQNHAKVACGYAAVKDVRTGSHEDRMDSFVLAETFKYLYLLFAEKEDLLVDLDSFLFTTEAHLLPLSLARTSNTSISTVGISGFDEIEDFDRSCPNSIYLFPGNKDFAHSIRLPLKNLVEGVCPKQVTPPRRLHAVDFQPNNHEHAKLLRKMGITIMALPDGRIQLLQTVTQAETVEDAEEGVLFMQEMTELSRVQAQQPEKHPRVVYYVGENQEQIVLNAGPAQFGMDLNGSIKITGNPVLADPIRGCQPLVNADDIKGKIGIIERGDCMFIDKARQLQQIGAVGGIVIDNHPESSSKQSPMFAMSGDGNNDVTIPLVFLFSQDAKVLLSTLDVNPLLEVTLAEKSDISGKQLPSEPSAAKSHIPTSAKGEAKEIDVDSASGPLSDIVFIQEKTVHQGGGENENEKADQPQPQPSSQLPKSGREGGDNENIIIATKELLKDTMDSLKNRESSKVLASNRRQMYLMTLQRILENAIGDKGEVDLTTKQLLDELSELMLPKPAAEEEAAAVESSQEASPVELDWSLRGEKVGGDEDTARSHETQKQSSVSTTYEGGVPSQRDEL